MFHADFKGGLEKHSLKLNDCSIVKSFAENIYIFYKKIWVKPK